MAEESESNSWQKQKMFFFSKASRLVLGPASPCSVGIGAVSQGIKWLWLRTNGGICPRHPYTLMACRGTFKFTSELQMQ